MTITLILVLSLLPAGCIAVYALRNGVKPYQLVCFVAASCAAVVVCSIIRNGVESFISALPYTRLPPVRWLIQAFILSAGIEEAGKAVFFFTAAHTVPIAGNESAGFSDAAAGFSDAAAGFSDAAAGFPDADCRSGKRIYLAAVFFGLVFGGAETISYGIRYSDIVYQRLFSTVLLHGALGSFYPVLCTAPRTVTVSCASVCTAAALHGFYNMFAAMGGFFSLCAAAVLIFTYNESRKKWRKVSGFPICTNSTEL